MVYGSWQKLATATLNWSGSRGSVDDEMEAFACTTLHDDRLVPAASALDVSDKDTPALSPEVCNKIGKQLREVYDSILREPIPDQFSELLSGLEYARD